MTAVGYFEGWLSLPKGIWIKGIDDYGDEFDQELVSWMTIDIDIAAADPCIMDYWFAALCEMDVAESHV